MNQTARLPLTGTAQPLTELKAAMIASECTSALLQRPQSNLLILNLYTAGGSDRREETIKPKSNSFSKLAAQDGVMAHAIRVTGATTVTLVQVAAGQLDLYW
jgi:fructose-1,6-bisphosphatase/inositol monophosphatase family enzyme